jgi:cytochrome P450
MLSSLVVRNGLAVVNLYFHTGPIVRIAPNRYSLQDSDAVRTIYSAGSDFEKSDYYLPFGPSAVHAKDIFSEMSKSEHARKRKACSQMYAMSTLISYEPFVNKVNATFAAKLADFAKRKEPFDLFTWMQFYAFDVIGEITIGRSFGLIEAGYDKDGLLDAVDFGNVRYGATIGLLPEIHTWYLWLIKLTSIANHFAVTQRVILREIGKRMQGELLPDRRDFLAKCIELQEQGKMDDSQTNNVIGSNIGAGSDTTGISLSAVIYFLLRNPRCMREVRREIDEAFQGRDLTDVVTFQEGQRLVYLQAVIKEALRCHAAVGSILSRVVPAGGAHVAGQSFPGGVCSAI